VGQCAARSLHAGATLRVSDAIVAAGGLTSEADPNCLPNLAAHLKDAKQIAVPSAPLRQGQEGEVDINTATREQLLLVPGMDAALADASSSTARNLADSPHSPSSNQHGPGCRDVQAHGQIARPELSGALPWWRSGSCLRRVRRDHGGIPAEPAGSAAGARRCADGLGRADHPRFAVIAYSRSLPY